MTKTAAQLSTSHTAVEGGSKHVLVVEDDDLVRDHVVQQVASLGCRVSEAPDEPFGLNIIRARADIDLLSTDIVMPGGMSGFHLAAAAKHLRPSLRILSTSDHCEDSVNHVTGWIRVSSYCENPTGDGNWRTGCARCWKTDCACRDNTKMKCTAPNQHLSAITTS